MGRRKKRKTYVHPLDQWLIEQNLKTGGVKIRPGTDEYKAWRQWRLHHRLKTAAMDKAAREGKPYMVPTEWPDYGERNLEHD